MLSRTVFVVLIFALAGCTRNPVADSFVDLGSQKVAGYVQSESVSLDDVFVWMDGFRRSTTTNTDGRFELALPPAAVQSNSGGVDGLFNIYYYMGNYALEKSDVIVRDGAFLASRGDLNPQGDLAAPVRMRRIVDIRTRVSPPFIRQNELKLIYAAVDVRARVDTASVLFPNSIGGLLGAVFLRNIATGAIEIVKGPPTELVDQVMVTKTGHTRTILFDLGQHPLAPGRYEVIPYLLLAHEVIPPALFASIGVDPLKVSPDYLKIPFKEDLAVLEVLE